MNRHARTIRRTQAKRTPKTPTVTSWLAARGINGWHIPLDGEVTVDASTGASDAMVTIPVIRFMPAEDINELMAALHGHGHQVGITVAHSGRGQR